MSLSTPQSLRAAAMTALAAAALVLAGCGSSGDPTRGGPAGAQGPITVGYVVVQPSSAPIEQELPGRITAYQISEVRPQVTGVIRRRLFTEGSIVRQGQPLYQIDPSLYRAAATQAAANLQSARANAEAARTLADRYKPLAEMEAVAKQDYTERRRPGAPGRRRRSRRTAPRSRRAQINLRFTTRPRADHRPDRPLAVHRRRAGHRQPDRSADHDPAARSDLSSTSSNRPPTC